MINRSAPTTIKRIDEVKTYANHLLFDSILIVFGVFIFAIFVSDMILSGIGQRNDRLICVGSLLFFLSSLPLIAATRNDRCRHLPVYLGYLFSLVYTLYSLSGYFLLNTSPDFIPTVISSLSLISVSSGSLLYKEMTENRHAVFIKAKEKSRNYFPTYFCIIVISTSALAFTLMLLSLKTPEYCISVCLRLLSLSSLYFLSKDDLLLYLHIKYAANERIYFSSPGILRSMPIISGEISLPDKFDDITINDITFSHSKRENADVIISDGGSLETVIGLARSMQRSAKAYKIISIAFYLIAVFIPIVSTRSLILLLLPFAFLLQVSIAGYFFGSVRSK